MVGVRGCMWAVWKRNCRNVGVWMAGKGMVWRVGVCGRLDGREGGNTAPSWKECHMEMLHCCEGWQ